MNSESERPGNMPDAEITPLIRVENVVAHYDSLEVLHNISFDVPLRAITVIMGVSGCGKSTLLKLLIGLKKPTHGNIYIDGKNLVKMNQKELNTFRKRIGVLFQGGALFNSMTVGENIAVPLRVHTKLSEETIRIMTQLKLEMVGLAGFEDFMPSQLSGGMKKRAGLARALAMDPEILFFDEPSSGLDPITSAGLDNLILKLKSAFGMTIVVVTHELESAFTIADRMIVMDSGEILAQGTPDEVKKSTNERVIQFLNREPEDKYSKNSKFLEGLIGKM